MAYHYYANPAGAWFVAPFDTQEHLDDYEVPNFYSQIEPPISEGASWVNGAWTLLRPRCRSSSPTSSTLPSP
jgi:hypothetical protein